MWISTRSVVAAAGSTAITANPATKTRPNATSAIASAIRPQATVKAGGPPDLTASRAATRSVAEQEGSHRVCRNGSTPEHEHQGEPEGQGERCDRRDYQPLAVARQNGRCELAGHAGAHR